jgi:CDP-diacylglycerol--glycerol-3-phosphate 3-phosphatidyltransferase
MDQTQPRTLSDFMRARFRGVVDGIGMVLKDLGVTPIALSLVGLAGHLVASVLLARGEFLIGGLFVLFLAPVDALDGALARLRGETSNFGGFFDSVIDRYSEMLVFGGLLIYFQNRFDKGMVTLVFVAAAGSLLVSYARARGEALGYVVRGGMLTRFERYLILIPSLLFGLPKWGVGIIAVLANLTAVQRFLNVRQQAWNKKEKAFRER